MSVATREAATLTRPTSRHREDVSMQPYASTIPNPRTTSTSCQHAKRNPQAKECWDCYSTNRRLQAKDNLWLRFWRNVRADGCWLWRGATFKAGYGAFSVAGHVALAHRLSYECWVGPIPHGLEIDHLCRVRSCVNPLHLEAVTPRENMRRGAGHGSEAHCPHGHAYDEANTYRNRGKRYCRECARAASRKWTVDHRVLLEVKR